MEENLRQRATKKQLRVTMPDGTVICHKSATMTMVDVLVAIGSENFAKITTENCHLPLLSREIYPRYKDYMKPVCDGWYINGQVQVGQNLWLTVPNQTKDKYKMLRIIDVMMKLGLEISII